MQGKRILVITLLYLFVCYVVPSPDQKLKHRSSSRVSCRTFSMTLPFAGLKVETDKTKYIVISRDQKAA